MMKRKTKVIINVVLVVVAALFVFINSTNLNPLYPEGAFFWCFLVTVIAAVNLIINFNLFSFSIEDDRPSFKWNKVKKRSITITLVVVGSLWAAYLLVSLISSPLFFWGAYRDQLGTPVQKEFKEDIQAIDTEQIPVVDKELAAKLADKKLGEKPSLGSQVNLGEPVIQQVDGKLIWAVPLHHSGFFKWLTKMDGAEGYIVVSATNPQDVTYVSDYKIKIQPNSYLLDDLTRRVRFTKGLFTGITDYSFELDDSGKPYWVVSTYHYKRGFSLPEADGVIIVDAQTGSMQEYKLGEVPSWVDRVQPEDFVVDQINNQGKYVHGIFNFSDTDKFRSSEGHIIVYNDGRCNLFTGITSVGGDESTIGFMMVDMVTKEPTMYRINGATEYAAMHSAQGKVQQYGYSATFPLILNIQGKPTYFMTLKDSAGLVKQYAYVSVEDYSIVGVGETVPEALEQYEEFMNNTGGFEGSTGEETPQEPQQLETVQGTIDRIAYEVREGDTVYSILLQETPGVIYQAAASVSPQLVLTQKGDTVFMKYAATDNGVLSVQEFSNLQIAQK